MKNFSVTYATGGKMQKAVITAKDEFEAMQSVQASDPDAVVVMITSSVGI